MYEIKVNETHDLGFFKNKIREEGPFDKNLDAIVFVFHVKNVGYVVVVSSPILKGIERAFYGAGIEKALLYATRDLGDLFVADHTGDSFELPWEIVLAHKDTKAHISLKTPHEIACEAGREEWKRDAREAGSYEGLLPLEHYIWQNDLGEYQVEEFRLETQSPAPVFCGQLQDEMKALQEAINAHQAY